MPSTDLLEFKIAGWLISLLGMVVNGSVILVTIKHKSLQGSCNLLIGSQAGSTALASTTQLIAFWVFLSSPDNMLPLRQCFLWQIVPNLALNFSNLIILFVGLERLLSVLFPLWTYKMGTVHKRIYVFLWNFLCLAYAFWIELLCWQAINEVENTQTICTTLYLYPGWVSDLTWRNVLVIAGTVVGIYVTIWVVLRKQKSWQQTKSYRETRQLFVSLAVNVVLIVVAWTLNSTVRQFIRTIGLSDRTTLQILYLNSYIYNIATAYTAPVLYAFSSEYRKAYNLSFCQIRAKLFCRGPFASSNQVHHLTNVNNTQLFRKTNLANSLQ